MRAAYIIPKSHAEVNQCVSLLTSTNYRVCSSTNGAMVGCRITVWFNVKTYCLNATNTYDHVHLTPNQLATALHKEL